MIINFTADKSPRPSPRSGSRRTSEEQGMAAIFICKERKQCLELKGKYPEPMNNKYYFTVMFKYVLTFK
jgi:hypothetical protein